LSFSNWKLSGSRRAVVNKLSSQANIHCVTTGNNRALSAGMCVLKFVIMDKAIHFAIRKIRDEERLVSLGPYKIMQLFIEPW
jgi:hypothetical protein